MAPTEAPAWFHNRVVDGLQMLVALALQGTPPAETVALTAQVWVATLWRARPWLDERDAQRIAAAFADLAARIDRWPAPRQLLDALPAVAPIALPAPRLSDAQRRANLQRLAEIMAIAQATLCAKSTRPTPREGETDERTDQQ